MPAPNMARQDLEALCLVGAFDDLKCERSDLAQRPLQLRPGIAAIGKDVTQPRPAFEDRFQHERCAIKIARRRPSAPLNGEARPARITP